MLLGGLSGGEASYRHVVGRAIPGGWRTAAASRFLVRVLRAISQPMRSDEGGRVYNPARFPRCVVWRVKHYPMTLRIAIALLCAVAGLTGAAWAELNPAALAPESRPFAVWLGEWTYTTDIAATPLGPADRVEGKMLGRPIADGRMMEIILEEKGANGLARYIECCWPDPLRGGYRYVCVGDGYFEEGPFRFDGTSCTWEARGRAGDRDFVMRGRETVEDKGRRIRREAEVSVEGRAWLPYFTGTFTKAAGRAEREEIAAVFARWAAAQAVWDKEAVFALFSPELRFWDLQSPAPLDRDGTDRMMTAFHDKMRVTAFAIEPAGIAVVGDVALAHGRYAEEFTRPDGVAMKSGGPWASTLLREGGVWRVLNLSHLSDPRPVDPSVTEKEIEALEHAWARAYVERDCSVLDRIEADEWVCTTDDGTVLGKAEDMADVKSAAYRATLFKMDDVRVRVFGDTAVATALQTELATYKGAAANKVVRCTDTWLRRDGRWQCVATHLSPVAKK